MKLVLLIAAVVLFAVVFVLAIIPSAGVAAITLLGLVALGLALAFGSELVP